MQEFDEFSNAKELQDKQWMKDLREFFVKYEIFKQFLIVSLSCNYEKYLLNLADNQIISYNHIITV